MASQKIAVVGENLVDLIVGQNLTVTAVAGGGPFNVARTLARLQQQVTFFSGISADAFGRVLEQRLHEADIELFQDHRIDLPTTLAVVDLASGSPEYFFHLNQTASFELPADLAVREFTKPDSDVTAVYFGTLGLLVDPMATTGEAIFDSLRPDVIAVLDPNCRPSATTDVARYKARLNRLMARADVVKVSTEDLDFLAPGTSYTDTANDYLANGVKVVIVTHGASAVQVITGSGLRSIEVPQTQVVDTVGAGDALVGGFLAWWLGHDYSRDKLTQLELLKPAVQAAIEVAALTCTKPGAEPPFASEMAASPRWSWLDQH
jgi:fructokinase